MADELHAPETQQSLPEFPPQTMMEALHMKFLVAEKDRVVITMPLTGAVMQPFGLLHGGASVALAETAASYGAVMNVDTAHYTCVGLEINCNHIRAKTEGMITAEAIPLHRGRSTQVWDIKIRDEHQNLVAVSRCTMAVVRRHA